MREHRLNSCVFSLRDRNFQLCSKINKEIAILTKNIRIAVRMDTAQLNTIAIGSCYTILTNVDRTTLHPMASARSMADAKT